MCCAINIHRRLIIDANRRSERDPLHARFDNNCLRSRDLKAFSLKIKRDDETKKFPLLDHHQMTTRNFTGAERNKRHVDFREFVIHPFSFVPLFSIQILLSSVQIQFNFLPDVLLSIL